MSQETEGAGPGATSEEPEMAEVSDCEVAGESVDTEEPAAEEAERAASGADESACDGEDLTEVKCRIEALLFSSDRPVSARRLATLSEASDGRQVRRIVKLLQAEYEEQGRAFSLEEIAGGFQLLTRAEYASLISQLHSRQQQDNLSKAALETLAIVAYRQPITRADVDDIRGVQSGQMLRSLVERRLLKVAGRSEELGRPLLYATTKHFLEVFGLRSIAELPKRKEFSQPPASKAPEPAEDDTAQEGPAEAAAEEQGNGQAEE
jgi:segregation and condensation protein B